MTVSRRLAIRRGPAGHNFVNQPPLLRFFRIHEVVPLERFLDLLHGLAGVVVAPFLSVFPGLADQVGFDAFVVVVLGGLGSMSGAFVAAILIGLLNSFGIQFIPTLAPLLTFGLMALVLTIKPTGLFGERQ